ncbi:MAG TPA: two-component regulator propeller domain-containing protein [Saprospiraceae bacterium]|nr:two-component regulator propeller domain-containing protein [Saprospiraceae bacterium]
MKKIVFLAFCILPFVRILSQNSDSSALTWSNNSHNNQIAKPDIIFDHLTEKDGLSYNHITDILRDKHGFLWIATTFGLNRYDGNKFDIFKRNRKDSTSIIHNLITAICEDPMGNIWGSTEEGVFCFDKKTAKFKNYYSQDKSIYPRLHTILCDTKSNIWAGSDMGLVKIEPKKRIFQYFRADTADQLSISDNRVGKRAVALDPSKKGLWVATNVGLNYFNFETEKFTNFHNTSDTTIFNNHRISALHIGKNGLLWMFDNTLGDLVGYETKQNKIVHRISITNYIRNPYGGNIFETSYGQLWYSSNSYETISVDLKNNNKISIYKNNVANPSSITGDYVSAAWEDTDQSLWLGTVAGVSRFNINRMFYRIIKLQDVYPELLNNWEITCLTQNPKTEEWWIGSRSGKIYIFNPMTNTSRVMDILKNTKIKMSSAFIVDSIDLLY